jgi:serine/threonine protein phosphatase PrpC
MISALPDVNAVPLLAGDRFLVLCCDEIWNVLSSQEVVDFVSERLNRSPPPSLGTVCEDLMAECLAPDTEGDGAGCDNMTALVVLLPGPEADAAHAALAGGAAAAAAAAAAEDAAACALTREAAVAAPAGITSAGEAVAATAAGAAGSIN